MVEADHFERQGISTEPVIYWIDPALDPESALYEKWVSPRHTHQILKKIEINEDDRTHTESVKSKSKTTKSHSSFVLTCRRTHKVEVCVSMLCATIFKSGPK